MDLKKAMILLIVITVGVYLGTIWSHKMIQKEEDARDEEFLKRQAAIAASTTA